MKRRSFLRKAAAGASAAAAAMAGRPADAQQGSQNAAQAAAVPPIRIPAEFSAAASAKPVTFEFPMTGAQVFARACKEEGVAALFACPGNYPVIHAIASSGIPAFGGRHEGSMAHAADAFIRVTGEIAVASGTEGPGFTDMICAIACANAARTPLLVVASNMSIGAEDTEGGIQLGYQQPTTEGLKKYGKRLIIPRRVHEYAGYAFRQLRTGVPKPVHLDFPAEVASAQFKDATELEFFHDKGRYRTDSRPHPSPKAITAAIDMIRKAQRPMIVSSNGVFYAKAWDALQRFAEKAQIPVVESGAMKGQFSDASPLSANASPGALPSVDLVILVGQHCMPTVGEFAFGPDAKYIRIDQAAEDIGRNLPIDLGIVSCELAALEALADAVPKLTHDSWIAEIAAARRKFEDQSAEYYKLGLSYTDAVHPAVIAKELGDFLYRGKLPKEQTTIASGGYGIARFVRRELRGFRPGQIMNGAYQYGAIGPDLGYAVGVAAAVQLGVGPQAAHKGHPIICITGDAGFGYTAMEIDTMAKYKLPVVSIVYNNNAWGTWTGATQDPKAMPIHLFQENLRYDKLAEALGGHGEYVTRAGDFRPALERAYQIAVREGRPSVINVQGKKEFWDRAKFPPGSIGKVEPGTMSYIPLTREPGAGSREPVTAALQAYADRGVFRGFRATPLGRGQVEYRFLWLTKRPMKAVFNPATRRLTFPSALPQIDRSAAADMKAAIDSRSSRHQPGHKRIDARRSRITGALRKGDFSVAVEIRGQNHAYAVSKALNLINEMFVILHEHHPGYLVERFGLSTE